MDIKELADKTVADIKSGALVVEGLVDVKEAVKDASGILGKIAAGAMAISRLVYSAVKYVETIGADMKLAGAEKRELVIQVINRLVDIPWLNESMEAAIIGFAIDVLITGFNEHFGHSWLLIKKTL